MVWYLLWRIILWGEVAATIGIFVGVYFMISGDYSEHFTWWLYNIISLALLIIIEKKVKPKSDKKYISGNSIKIGHK
jgi:uncharacterized membrane protein YfcA